MEDQNTEDLPISVNGMAQHRMINSLVVSGSTRRPAKTLMIPLFSGKACAFMALLMALATNFSSLKTRTSMLKMLLVSLMAPTSVLTFILRAMLSTTSVPSMSLKAKEISDLLMSPPPI